MSLINLPQSAKVIIFAAFAVLICFAVDKSHAATNPFKPIAAEGDFELVENITRARLPSNIKKRCFIRSRAAGMQRPAFFIYPANSNWNLQLPQDVESAAIWEQESINMPGSYIGFPVEFKISVDGGQPLEQTIYVRDVNPHKKRYISFTEPTRANLYAFLQSSDTLRIEWNHRGIGSTADRLIKRALEQNVSTGEATYNTSGVPNLLKLYQEQCAR